MNHSKLLRWLDCQRCPLGSRATKHVIGRGKLPCDFLCVGEAPGRGEDAIGQAFVGPAGKLLDAALKEAQHRAGTLYEFAFANCVACRPCDKRGGPNRKPNAIELAACYPLLESICLRARPRGFLMLGQTAQQYAGTIPVALGYEWKAVLFAPHPAFVLCRGGIGQTYFYKYVDKIVDFFLRFHGKEKSAYHSAGFQTIGQIEKVTVRRSKRTRLN